MYVTNVHLAGGGSGTSGDGAAAMPGEAEAGGRVRWRLRQGWIGDARVQSLGRALAALARAHAALRIGPGCGCVTRAAARVAGLVR
jgi:hypothetical protein